ncbi:hypothetical protein IEQ34_004769 [Dendrobium chrysotoxum]|uniref:Glycosyltransferase n=1 Tax=Dendrobium chrysotoxum TaxID=161865 RepID=A0AAV7H6Y6_DENCH|nr:hypothetical protein IEQ34_004769 [Dendrobium chrysotoxum]
MSQPSRPFSSAASLPHILLIPSAGMGHLVPFVRLATALSIRRITVSILAARPTVSAAESHLLSSLPSSIPIVDFPLAPLDPSYFPPSSDPFYLHYEALRRSAHLLPPLLSVTGTSFSALIIDVSITSTFLPVASAANIPCFLLFTSSASMFALYSSIPSLSLSSAEFNIAGVLKIPNSSLPPPLRDPTNLFTTQLVDNSRALPLSQGILINTFPALETEVLTAFNSGHIVPGFPPVIAVGPLPPLGNLAEKQPPGASQAMRWLDQQPERSVMYVSFGSRTALPTDQIRELGAGLEMSGCRFLWVVKSTKVDREETGEIEELVGKGYSGRVEGRGLVVREWVEQVAVLGHRAVAGFLSHCGWNSVMEAAAAGVTVLAWPRTADQRVNAALVARRGVGVWPEHWVWEADEGVVAAEEIGNKVREVMRNQRMRETAAKLVAEATVEQDGSSDASKAMLSWPSLSRLLNCPSLR